MKKEVMELWVAALRSGKYKQAKNRLRDGDSFCCLGVLCDISGIGTWKQNLFTTNDGQTCSNVLSPAVQAYSGINFECGRLIITNDTTQLAILNDSGKSFEEIAALIEKHHEEL